MLKMKNILKQFKSEKMKKLFFLPAATFILATTVNAQTNEDPAKNDMATTSIGKSGSLMKKEKKEERKELRKLKGNEVSYQAKQAFYRDFENIQVSQWERLDNFDETTFIKDGQAMSAFYDYDAQLVGTTANKTFTDLPANAQKYIDKKYADYTIGDVLFFDDNELNETDMILYNTQFDDQDSYFVELNKDNKKIVLQVAMNGDVSFFTRLK
jgi:hypothetical protein